MASALHANHLDATATSRAESLSEAWVCACLLRSWQVVVGGRHSYRISVWVGSRGCLQIATANAAASVSHAREFGRRAGHKAAGLGWLRAHAAASQAAEPSAGAGPCAQCPAVKSRADARAAQLPRLRAEPRGGRLVCSCVRQPYDFGDWRAVTHLLGAKRGEEGTRRGTRAPACARLEVRGNRASLAWQPC